MEKIFTLDVKLIFKANETILKDGDSNFGQAMDNGAVELIKSNVLIMTAEGAICEDEKVIEDTLQAVLYGLRERT
jgi:hypothetical protein